MTFILNALLERVTIENRTAIVTEFLNHASSAAGCTLPGGIHIGSDDDLRRLLEFLKAFPSLEQALAQRIASAASAPVIPSMGMAGVPIGPAGVQAAQIEYVAAKPADPAVTAAATTTQAHQPRTRHDSPTTWPKAPMRFHSAVTAYLTHHRSVMKSHEERTSDDKERLLNNLGRFLLEKHPELGDDPWVHDIHVGHVSAFLTQEALKPGKRKNEDGGVENAAARTMLKKASDISHPFNFFLQRKMTLELISADLADDRAAWKKRAKEEDVHYHPFTDSHLKSIFSVESYLAANRDPMLFWCPLLGIHLGGRLGEYVNLLLRNVGYMPEIDCWYIDVTPEDAKNKNSVRRLPITQPLVELGFIEYVEHVRSLGGAKYLFPMWNWDTPTLRKDPSKYASRDFGAYLDTLGLIQRELVFHSFRHTVVSAMQDAGIPLSIAMQIVGHEAQSHALRTGKISESEARSVHLQVYTHADLKRMGTDYPILALRSALERSIQPPIDYDGLQVAAEIVRQHVKKVGDKFRGGWPTQNERYTAKQLEWLREQMSC